MRPPPYRSDHPGGGHGGAMVAPACAPPRRSDAEDGVAHVLRDGNMRKVVLAAQ